MPRTERTEAYAEWISEWQERGFEPWLITFMFDQLPGSAAAQQEQMLRIVEKIYVAHLTRVIRRPSAPAARDGLPIWITMPDLPVFKHARQDIKDVSINDGAHINGIALSPPVSRREENLAKHFWAHVGRYRHICPGLARIDVRAVTHDLETVSDYIFKSVERGLVCEDSVLILPRTRSEVRGSGRPTGRNSSIFSSARTSPIK